MNESIKLKLTEKWCTYDDPPHEPSNAVLCPICATLFVNDPSLKELDDQTPDPTRKCVSCDKFWNLI